MAAPAIINIVDLQAHETVRVILISAAASKLFNFSPVLNGLSRQGMLPAHNLEKRVLRRVTGFNRRNFLAEVLDNDTINEALTLEIEDPSPRKGRVYYRLTTPYSTFFKISRLVQDANTDLTEEEERARRVQRRRMGNDFFHPFSQFVPISLVT